MNDSDDVSDDSKTISSEVDELLSASGAKNGLSSNLRGLIGVITAAGSSVMSWVDG